MSDELTDFLEVDEATVEQAEPEQEPIVEPEPEPEKVEAQAEPEDSPTEPEEHEEHESGRVPIAALLDEREKRQAAVRELEEIKKRMEQDAPKVETPDVLDDQEGFVAHLQSQIKAETANARIEVSQDVMRMLHEDYDDMESKFIALAEESPDLARKMSESVNPARFAYETAKKAMKFAEMENVDEWEAKKTAEIEAKLREQLTAEITAAATAKADTGKSLTPSLTAQRAQGGNTVPPQEVPDPLSTTFNR